MPHDTHRTVRKPHQAVAAVYLVALGLIAGLSLLGYWLVGRAVESYSLDAPLLNQAGRQRMLSQKIAKDLLRISLHPEPGRVGAELDELAKDFSTWSGVHAALGREREHLAVRKSAQVRALYDSVHRSYASMAQPIEEILAGAAAGRPIVPLGPQAGRVAEASSEYLAHMDALVGAYEREARWRVDRLRRIQGGLLAAVLGLLTAEALLIFRPLARRVRRSFEELEAEKEAASLPAERLRLALEAAEVGTWDWDIQRERLDWDRRSRAIVGLPPDVPLSYEMFLQTIHPDDRGRVQEAVASCLQSGRDYEAEYRAVRADGEVRWIAVRGGLLRDPRGRPARMVGVATDITGRREYEAAMARAEAAEAAHRATGEFMAVASHELHTPLNAILGYSDLLLDGVEGPLNPAQRRSLERLAANGRRLVRLADAVLDLSRLRAGALQLQRADLRLRESLAEGLVRHGERARSKGLAFSWGVDPDVPDALRGDAVRLLQALGALADNAVKFTERGKVTVAVHREGNDGTGECLRFEVADTGIGIRPEDQGRIFQAFEQAEPADTHSREGLGLGLPICAALASQMGGRIWCESEPGRGSTFFFTACFGAAD